MVMVISLPKSFRRIYISTKISQQKNQTQTPLEQESFESGFSWSDYESAVMLISEVFHCVLQ